jgi:hypothetical protein
MPLIRILLVLVSCWWTLSASAQGIEPAPDWQSADSAHFRINYRAAWRPQAERVARIAEKVYPKVTQALGWEPRGRTEILLIDQYDLPNGFSTPLPFNIIGVFLAPPDEGELLDNSDWLELLLTHEFTHTVHLDKVRGVPSVLQSVFGRFPYFFPNLFSPNWMVEGLAVHGEGDPATGRGRLRGPAFEAWLRAESRRGFPSLRELNANGRTLPVSKSYLYGAYFFDFVARRYGPDSVQKMVHHYSGNPPFWPRLHTNPYETTGKTMDVLWDEFLADLKQQVDERAKPLAATPETVGEPLAGPMFGIGSVAGLADGSTLAVLDDGLHHAKLVKIAADGRQQVLADVSPQAEIEVAPDGRMLVAQPDICNWRYYAFDVYRLEAGGGLQQLTHCARLRHAADAKAGIVGLQQGQGITRLVLFNEAGEQQRVLWTPDAGVDLIDLAVSPDGRQVSVASKRNGNQWRIDAFDLSDATPAPRLLLTHDAPLHGLSHGDKGLEFIAVRDGVYNVWRQEGEGWVKLTHTLTRVTAQGGTQADGALSLAVVAPGGQELRRMASTAPLARAAAAPAAAPVAAGPGVEPAALGTAQSYSSLRSMYPRTWFPVAGSDKGLASVGATTLGADALGWHQYAATLAVETTQGEALGSLQYLFQDQHLLTVQRTLTARAWRNNDDSDEVTAYDRNTELQWLTLLPWLRIDRRITFGVGAALDHVQRVDPDRVTSGAVPRTERLLAVLLDVDTSGGNWWSEGRNRGQHATLLYETYRPFARDGRNDYDGAVLRLDWRAFVPLGRTVFALRHTEARASGLTERFQLGGAVDPQLQMGVALNSRDITLRGYRGDERSLVGASARVTSLEWRTPIADVDRHFMAPAVGVNRVSGTLFFDIGGAWDTGHRPLHYQRGMGAELLGEFRLLYALGVQLRLGVARGLDEPKGTRGYLAIGRGF